MGPQVWWMMFRFLFTLRPFPSLVIVPPMFHPFPSLHFFPFSIKFNKEVYEAL